MFSPLTALFDPAAFSSFSFSRPDLLALLWLLPLFWVWQWRAFRSLASLCRLFLHSLVFAIVVAAAAGLHMLHPGAASVPLLAIDLSRSVTAAQRQWVRDTITRHVRPTADTPTLVFAGTVRRLPWRDAEALLADPPPDLQLTATNLDGVFSALLADSQQRNVYLFTDGWQTRGSDAVPSLAEEDTVRLFAPLLAERGITVHPFPLPPAETPPNVALQRFSLPPATSGGESIPVSVALENTNPTPVRGELVVTEKEKVVWRQDLVLPPGGARFTRPLVVSDTGLVPLRAVFTPAIPGQDSVPQDNRATAWVRVTPREEVLLVSAGAQDNRYIERVLRTRGFTVTAVAVADTSAIPAPDAFAAVILNNVARGRLPAAFLDALDGYVGGGGGLVMIGGEESLGLGGYKGTAVEKLLPVAVVPPQKEERRTAVLLVIDTSGSMRRENKLLYAKEGARAVARNLKDQDLFGVIGFDQEPFVVIPLETMGRIRDDVEYRLNRLKASGGTNLYPALLEAKRQLERQTAARKYIIVLTDGETGGSGSDYLDLVTVMHGEQKIAITTIAVGEEPNLRLLSRIADYGGGAFHHTTDPSTLPDLFIDQLEDKGKEEKTMVEKELVPLPNPASPLLKGVAGEGRFPAVKGYVETQAKPGARVDITLQTEKRPPLLASWAYGQGKAVAFTSDANGRWSAPWVSWEGFGKVWGQAVRWVMSEAKRKEEPHFAAEVGHNDKGLVVDVFSYGNSEDGRGAFARVSGPDGEGKTVPLERIAPGHYQHESPAVQAGDYRVEVTLPSGEKLGPLGHTIPPRQTGEIPQPQSNLSLLETLARATGGAVNPDVTTVAQPQSPPEQRPLLSSLIPLAMLVYFVELLVRRGG